MTQPDPYQNVTVLKSNLARRTERQIECMHNYAFVVSEPASTRWHTYCIKADSGGEAMVEVCHAAGRDGFSEQAKVTLLGYAV